MTDRAKERGMKQMRTELGKQPTTVAEWLHAKTKFPKDFTINTEGDFIVPPVNPGDSEQILVVKPEVPATIETIQGFFAKRKESLKEPEENYTSAKRQLHEVITAYNAGLVGIPDVLDANQNVHIAECTLNAAAKLPRSIQDLTGTLEEKDLTLDHYAKRSIAEKVSQVTYSVFPWNAFWSVASETQAQEGKITEQEQVQIQEQPQKPKRVLTEQQRAIIASRRKASSVPSGML
jgi:hypothetical protein